MSQFHSDNNLLIELNNKYTKMNQFKDGVPYKYLQIVTTFTFIKGL